MNTEKKKTKAQKILGESDGVRHHTPQLTDEISPDLILDLSVVTSLF